MKEQNETPEKELNEIEISNLSDAEFKTLVIRCSRNSLGTSTAQNDPGRNESYTK